MGPVPMVKGLVIFLLMMANCQQLESAVDVTVSLWIDTWHIKDHFVVLQDGSLFLAINVTERYHIISLQDDNRVWMTKQLPIPEDYIMNLGVINSTKGGSNPKQLLRLFENLQHVEATKYRVTGDKPIPPTRGNLANACNKLNSNNWQVKRSHPTIAFCDVRLEALADDKYRGWAQHQRDNTVGVEPRLFVVDGNGEGVQVTGRHATLSYTFTVNCWFVHRGAEGSTVLFWQGAFILATVISEGTQHYYKLYIGEDVEVYSSSKVDNVQDSSAPVNLIVVRDLAAGSVKMWENGKKLHTTKDGHSADALFAAFEQISDDLENNVVLKLEAKDSATAATEVKDLYEEMKGKVAVPAAAVAAASAGKTGQSAAASAAAQASRPPAPPPTAAAGDKSAEADPAAVEVAREQDSPVPTITINGIKRGGTVHAAGFLRDGDFTVAMFASVRDIVDEAVLVFGRDLGLKIVVQEKEKKCRYRMVYLERHFMSTDAEYERDSPTHIAIVHQKEEASLRLFHRGSALDLKPADQPTEIVGPDVQQLQTVGIVLSFDVLQSASPVEYIRSLSNLRGFLPSGSGKRQQPPPVDNKPVPMDLDIAHLPHIGPVRVSQHALHHNMWLYLIWGIGVLGLGGVVLVMAFTSNKRRNKSGSSGCKISKVV
uniref:Uncharacterized protein n=1 Tax=Eutreptiella gymnastica TaxID=73025 RepID=A0A7S1J3A4_9EUGL|mmetsp:Transcript_62139/g.110754  ORF Transcript_62139/g.110754 Transcript_62139/m.110754 type:complete len:655 (+) Transcript_62139:159-2123(+)